MTDEGRDVGHHALALEQTQILGVAFEAPVHSRAQRFQRHAFDVGEIAQREIAIARRHGAIVKPQLPITTLVTPNPTDGVANESHNSCAS